jgi:uncharacterized protein (DUF488 family)
MRVLSAIFTVGHGRRPADELVTCLREAAVETLVDVRSFPGSRRNPQYNRAVLAGALEEAGIRYTHAVELGGMQSRGPGSGRFACLGAFASYAARIGTGEWQGALRDALEQPAPCFMCAETPWQKCHRRFVAEVLVARGYEVVHLIRPGEREPHIRHPAAETRDGRLYLCGHEAG